MNNHTLQNTKEEPMDLETIQTAAHTHKVPFIAQEKRTVSCSGFLPNNTSPIQH